MAEIVNLRQARKLAQRRERQSQAEAARAKHGLPKGERKLAEAERERSASRLESHRLCPDRDT